MTSVISAPYNTQSQRAARLDNGDCLKVNTRRYHTDTLSATLVLREGNLVVTSWFPSQRGQYCRALMCSLLLIVYGSCLVTWFCYHVIAKPGNKTAPTSWPDPYAFEQTVQLPVIYNAMMLMWRHWWRTGHSSGNILEYNRFRETSFLQYHRLCKTDNILGTHYHWVHDDVIKWKHSPHYWPFVWGIHRSPVNSPHKGQWRGALMFSFICPWINGWVNNCEAGDLRHHRGHYDVIVMLYSKHNIDHVSMWSVQNSHHYADEILNCIFFQGGISVWFASGRPYTPPAKLIHHWRGRDPISIVLFHNYLFT